MKLEPEYVASYLNYLQSLQKVHWGEVRDVFTLGPIRPAWPSGPALPRAP